MNWFYNSLLISRKSSALISLCYKSYYERLGLLHSASPEDIKSAYIDLSKKHHPDVQLTQNSGFENSNYFLEVKEAYDVLSNPIAKKEYDLKNFGRSSDFNRFSSGEYELYQRNKNAGKTSQTSEKKVGMENTAEDNNQHDKPSLFSVSPRVGRLLHYLYGAIAVSGLSIYIMGRKFRNKSVVDAVDKK